MNSKEAKEHLENISLKDLPQNIQTSIYIAAKALDKQIELEKWIDQLENGKFIYNSQELAFILKDFLINE